MRSRRRRRGLVKSAVGIAAAGVTAAVAAERFTIGRLRLRPDPDAREPFGELRGQPVTVLADDRVPLHVEIDGDDDAPLTVIFVHGYTLNQDCWHYQRRDLGDIGRLVFYDQRSHGRSGRSDPAHASIDQLGKDLYQVIRGVAPDSRPVMLVGHSMGGMTIMALADQHPELFGEQIVAVALISTSAGRVAEVTFGLPAVAGKVLQRAAPRTVAALRRRAQLVERGWRAGNDLSFLVTRFFAFGDPGVSPSVVDFLETMIRETTFDVIADFYAAVMNHDKLAALPVLERVPTLVMVGDKDRLTPCEHSEAIAGAVKSADLVVVPDTGHLVILERPGVVNDALRRLAARARAAAETEERSA